MVLKVPCPLPKKRPPPFSFPALPLVYYCRDTDLHKLRIKSYFFLFFLWIRGHKSVIMKEKYPNIMIVTIQSSEDLATHLDNNSATLVDFWAPWCGPCKAMNPVLDQLSKETSGHLSVVKINIDEAPELASSYEITSIPSLKLFVKGKNVASKIGGQSLSDLKSWISSYIPTP